MDKKSARFKVLSQGPLEVTGHFRILDAEGKILEKEGPVFLCRCGGSGNKPFCDGTHRRKGFTG